MRTIFEQETGRTDVALGWSSRIMGLTRVLGGILLFAMLHNRVHAMQGVTLVWNQSLETSVTGYKVHDGVASRAYTNMVNAGNATSTTISGLVEGTTYFFAVTAYNTLEQESDWSDEVSYIVPGTIPEVPAKLQIRAAPADQIILTATGEVGRTYNIQASPDFTNWTVIGAVLMPAGGLLNFTDTNAANFPNRFYRTQY